MQYYLKYNVLLSQFNKIYSVVMKQSRYNQVKNGSSDYGKCGSSDQVKNDQVKNSSSDQIKIASNDQGKIGSDDQVNLYCHLFHIG